MAGPERIEWRRRSPQRVLSNFGWYGAVSVLVVACVWLLFGRESRSASGGAENPLAALPALVTVLAAVGALVMMLPVLRRPLVAANHYALLVRPGFGRTLALPWAGISEVAIVTVDHGRYLLVRRRAGLSLAGARPGWADQGPLRRLRRLRPDTSWSGYDLAVPMVEFTGGLRAQVAALAAFAPDTVAFVGGPVS